MSTVTAIVSAYYAEKFIKARLDNLNSQTLRPSVFCIVQSTSREERIALNNGAACFVTTNLPTLYHAWNLAIKHSESDYLTSANCDDLFYPDGIKVLAEYLDAHPEVDIVHGDCDIEDEKGKRAWKRNDKSVSARACRIGPMPMWRRSLHNKFGMFDEKYQVAGDHEFWMRCVKGGAVVAKVKDIVGIYRQRDDSIEHRLAGALAKERQMIMAKYE